MRTTIAALLLCASGLPVLAQEVPGVREASQRFTSALSSGDAATAASMMADDVFVVPPGRSEMRTKSEAQNFLGSMTRAVGNLQYTTVDIRPIGDNAAREIGTFSFTMKGRQGGGGGGGRSAGGNGGGGQQVTGKYLIIWDKSGGDWKVAADMWNRNSSGGNGGGGGGRGGMRRGGGGGQGE
ncbi:MAG: nuclear transport factor 2 family protein [Parafilimonas terrae]|nr:nuclear transport factor 2 family protein [Parafilimonas terrae]